MKNRNSIYSLTATVETNELDQIAKASFHKSTYRTIFNLDFHNRNLSAITNDLEEMSKKRTTSDEFYYRKDGINVYSFALSPNFNIKSLFDKKRFTGAFGSDSFKIKKSLQPFLFNELEKYVNSELCSELLNLEAGIRQDIRPQNNDYDTYLYLKNIEEIELFKTEKTTFYISGKEFRCVMHKIDLIVHYLNKL